MKSKAGGVVPSSFKGFHLAEAEAAKKTANSTSIFFTNAKSGFALPQIGTVEGVFRKDLIYP